MSEEKLSDRKKKILTALVDSYISEAEPISSSTIQEKYLPDVSSATIRSELATLEDMGYLETQNSGQHRRFITKAGRNIIM